MNPILKKQFDSVKSQIDALHSVLEENQEELSKQHAEKEELLQEKWRIRKRLTTLERIESEYDVVQGESKKYREERGHIRESLNAIVSLSKALHRTQKP